MILKLNAISLCRFIWLDYNLLRIVCFKGCRERHALISFLQVNKQPLCALLISSIQFCLLNGELIMCSRVLSELSNGSVVVASIIRCFGVKLPFKGLIHRIMQTENEQYSFIRREEY